MSNDKPLISVIMPVKNNKRFFPKAVESVLNQNFEDWELVIVEGFSDDGTSDLADEYAETDKRIRVFHEDEWIYESLNIGISRCSGEYVTFLNSDDLFMQGALKKAAEYIKEYGVDLFLFAVKTVTCDAEQRVLSDDSEDVIAFMPNEFVLNGNLECRSNWATILRIGLLNNQLNVYKKSVIKDLRFRNDIFGADYYFNLEMLPRMKSIAYYPECLYRFNAYKDVPGMNASVGKYYPYLHIMHNDFYYKSIEIFATHGCLNEDVLRLLRRKRIAEFEGELVAYTSDSCKLSLEQRLYELFAYTADLFEIFLIENAFKDYENKVLSVSYSLISFLNEDAGKMTTVCNGIKAIFEADEGGEADINAIFAMVRDYYNPAHIGVTVCNKLLE
ncbi:glycosyltransferase family 2 protein [Butyrivibrio sp. YAB3001]|uniref:glycosyltransferase family 2 protein n=1 Tax=Butyrivibrio sp. YAB3001 TaxID=1520812 RepID=UPI0008F64F07|nr:glycosyltransferase [Butyrivibrio sp. YAB3001]SFB95109.1 Glycosyl transferase family 2 [Butyrivibrio sp. YAB3001]